MLKRFLLTKHHLCPHIILRLYATLLCLSVPVFKKNKLDDQMMYCVYVYSLSLFIYVYNLQEPSFFHLVLLSAPYECVSGHEKKPSVNSLGYISNLPPSVSLLSQASLLYLSLIFWPLNLHLELLTILKTLLGPYCSRSLFLNLECR